MGPIGVVLVHGTRASRTMWLRQLEALAQARVPAVAPDLPGHGRRAGEPFTLDGAVAAVEEAAASLAGDGVVAACRSAGTAPCPGRPAPSGRWRPAAARGAPPAPAVPGRRLPA